MATPDPQAQQPIKKHGGCLKWGAITVGALVVLFLAIGLAGGWDRDETNEGTNTAEGVNDQMQDADEALMGRTLEMHRLLDLAFEGCEWDIPDEWSTTVVSGCEEHNLFTVVGPGESSTMHVMEAMADANPWSGYYAIEDGAGVLAFDAGDRNLAQDMLGGPALTSGSFDP